VDTQPPTARPWAGTVGLPAHVRTAATQQSTAIPGIGPGFLMTQPNQQASGVLEAPAHGTHADAEANAMNLTDKEGHFANTDTLSDFVDKFKEMLLRDLHKEAILSSNPNLLQQLEATKLNDSPDSSGTKRIELRASPDFAETLDKLCSETGLSRADVIRRGVALYARALVEKSAGRVISIAALEDNQIKIKEIIQV
jgi:hypothetical protein